MSSVVPLGRSFLFFPISFCLFFLLLISSHPDAAAQSSGERIVLSPRVGETIDEYERRYFDLFNSVGNFSSARIERGGEDAVRIVIARGNGMGDTALALSDTVFRELQRAVDHYESLFLGEDVGINWKPLAGFISPNSPLGTDTLSLTVSTRTGTVRGRLLHADSRYLAIAPDSLEQGWPQVREHAVVILPEEILGVHAEGSGAGFFSEIDLPVSGNDTIYRRDVAGRMGHRAWFPYLPYPELHAMAVRKLAGRGTEGGSMASVEEIDRQLEPFPFTIAAGAGWMVRGRETEVGTVFHNSVRAPITTTLPENPYLSVRASYDMLGLIRLGVSYLRYPGLPDDIEEGYQAISSSSQYEVGARILLQRGRRTFLTTSDRIDISVGASKLWRSVEIESMLGYSSRIYPNINPGIRTLRQSGSVDGVALMAGVGYWLQNFLSVELEGRYSLYEDFRVRQQEIWSLDGTKFVVAAYRHNLLSLDSGDLLLWLRFHF